MSIGPDDYEKGPLRLSRNADYLTRQRLPPEASVPVRAAIMKGDLAFLRAWCGGDGNGEEEGEKAPAVTWPPMVYCSLAVAWNQFETFQFLHEHGCPWGKQCCAIAAGRGLAEFMRYALDHGCPCSGYEVCQEAASHGHLECLAIAHEQGCPWSSYSVLEEAAKNGHLDCLAYAHDHGCSWGDKRTFFARGVSAEVLQYLGDHRCSWEIETRFANRLDRLRKKHNIKEK